MNLSIDVCATWRLAKNREGGTKGPFLGPEGLIFRRIVPFPGRIMVGIFHWAHDASWSPVTKTLVISKLKPHHHRPGPPTMQKGTDFLTTNHVVTQEALVSSHQYR